MPASSVALGLILVVTAGLRGRRPDGWSGALTLGAFALALMGEAGLLTGRSFTGTVATVVAMFLALAGVFFAREDGPHPDEASPAPRYDRTDVLCIAVVTLLAVFFRFYALNRVFDYFEGELSPYMVGATDLRGMLYADVGYLGPWAPLGYFYYLPIFATTKLFGTTVLAVRLASAVVSVLTVPLMYGLLRRISSREAAIVGAFLVALDPLQIGWGRSDIHPHGSTVWTAILLAGATFEAFRTGKWTWFAAVIVLMGLSCHHYPSGQAAVAMPIGFFFWMLAFERRQALTHLGRWLAALVAGVALWLLGLAFPYWLALGQWKIENLFTVFGVRTSWDQVKSPGALDVIAGVAYRASSNFVDLVEGIFVRVPYLFHQCFIPPFPNLPPRTVVWLAAPFLAVTVARALRRRKPAGNALLIVWVICGIVPAVFSAEGYPKRASIAYPPLLGLGAIGIATTLRECAVVWEVWARRVGWTLGAASAAAFVTATTYQWFSGRNYPYGMPVEIGVAKRLEAMLEPGTIVVGDYWNHYNQGKFAYLLMDAMGNEQLVPIVYYVFNSERTSFDELMNDPTAVTAILPGTIWYRWTDLWNQLPLIRRWHHWKAVVFLFQIDSYGNEHLPIRDRFEKARERCVGSETVVLDDPRRDRRFALVRCPVGSLSAESASSAEARRRDPAR